MHRYGSGMSGWGYGLTTVSLVLFWGLVIAGITLLSWLVTAMHFTSQMFTVTRPRVPDVTLGEPPLTVGGRGRTIR